VGPMKSLVAILLCELIKYVGGWVFEWQRQNLIKSQWRSV
jgi:hypothetical protein